MSNFAKFSIVCFQNIQQSNFKLDFAILFNTVAKLYFFFSKNEIICSSDIH